MKKQTSLHVGIVQERYYCKTKMYICETNVGVFIATKEKGEKLLRIRPPRNAKDLTHLERFRYRKDTNIWTTELSEIERSAEVLTELIKLYFYRNSSKQLQLF